MKEILLGICLGGSFGFALYFAGAANPKRIVAMLRLQNLALMKIILFGIGFGSILLSIAGLAGWISLSHLIIKPMHLGVIIGGLIFGLGFGYGGSCPGTCAAALGTEGYRRAIAGVLGGLLGAWVFSLVYGLFADLGLFEALSIGKKTLFAISDKYPSVFSIGFWGLLVMGIVFVAISFVLPEKPGIKKEM